MKQDLQNSSFDKRFDHIFSTLKKRSFLNLEDIGNDLPFFICPYKAKEALEMEKMRKNLVTSLLKAGVTVKEINIYDLCVEILKKNKDWDFYIEEETQMSKQELKEELQSILDIETVVVPEIAEILNQSDYDIVFISGIGEVYPYLRSHNILNNLQSTIKNCPMLMFFPGEYTNSMESGAFLELFGKLHDDKYYRAFNIYHYQIKSED
ncbi:MAG: DUF1788 domain-containing protein [Desulfobacteraceae bacterium]|nr:DUF1788 domain-containing protein [Desulfobacteraceae bacterium]